MTKLLLSQNFSIAESDASKPREEIVFRRIRNGFALLCAAALLLSGHSAQAATKTWGNGGTATTDFNLGTNWTGGLPGTADDALFAGASSLAPNVTTSLSINSLNFSNNASVYTLSSIDTSTKLTLLSTGSGSTVGNAAIVSLITTSQETINAPLVLGAASAATQTLYQATGGLLILKGVISEANAGVNLNFTAGGTTSAAFLVSGANTYTGNTSLTSGIVAVGSNSSNSTTAFFGTGGTLVFAGGQIRGSTTAPVDTGKTYFIANAVNVTAATATFASGTANGDTGLTFTGATTLTGVGGTSKTFAVNTSPITGATGITFSNAIGESLTSGSGGIGLIKNGTGTLILSGTNTYSGGTTINAGALNINTNGSLGASTSGLTLNGGSLQYTGSAGGVAVSSSRAISIGASGGTFDGSGTLASSTFLINGTNNLTMTGSGARNITLTGTMPANAEATANVFSPLITDDGSTNVTSLVKSGATYWTLGSANTYTGSTTINAGILTAGVTNALPTTTTLTINGGKFNLNGSANQTLAVLNGAGAVENTIGGNGTTNGVLTVSSGNFTGTLDQRSSQAARTLALVKTSSGTLILTNANAFAGSATVNDGTLRITNSKGLGTGVAGNVGASNTNFTTVTGGGTLDLNGGTSAIIVNEAITLNGGSLINGSTTNAATLNNGVASVLVSNAGAGSVTAATLTFSSGAAAGTVAFNGGAINSLLFGTPGSGYTTAPTITVTPTAGSFTTSPTVTAILSSLTLTGSSNTIGGAGNLTINAVVGGSGGGFSKTGAGTVTLSAANTYTGTTKISAGTLSATGATSLINSGTLVVDGGSTASALLSVGTAADFTGKTVNITSGNGGAYQKDLLIGEAYARYGAAKSAFTGGNADTTAAFLGSGTTGAARSVLTSFADAPGAVAGNDGTRVSDVFSLNGTSTDTIVLQLTLAPGGAVTAGSFLGYYSGGLWINAVTGNTGGTNIDQGNVAWNSGFGLGSYGRDTTTGSVWAVINHNSEFAIVPEPSTWILLAFSLTTVMVLRRRAGRP